MAERGSEFDVVVLGAGAAGMMCAAEAGRRGRSVLLLEHGERVGRKILISGGGRCNFTNIHARAENFLSANPHFAKSALARFTPRDFVALVERHGIRYHEKTLGQLFCDGSARQIVGMLERECEEARVETRCGVVVSGVRRTHVPESEPFDKLRAGSGAPNFAMGRFVVATGEGEIGCGAVVVATGGLSIPKMGATGFGYEIARRFGHEVVEPRPGLVPLVFGAEDRERWCDLAGVAAEVVAGVKSSGGLSEKQVLRLHPSGQRTPAGGPSRAQDDKSKKERALDDEPNKERGLPRPGATQSPVFREALLVTHRGVSGPAVLQVSSYWRPGGEVRFDLAPGREVLAPRLAKNARRDRATLMAALRGVLPARFAERWVALQMGVGKADWTNAGIARMERELHAWTLRPEGSEGFGKAEVTVGGVDTRELDARTMESRRVPGLYFIGEVVDVTGWLGGYNFQWAWASAVAAGQAA